MESYNYTQFPDDASNVHVALFTNVTNAADLRNRLVQASTMPGESGEAERQAVDFAFVDATLVGISCFTVTFQSILCELCQ